jgi:hypothetical protein
MSPLTSGPRDSSAPRILSVARSEEHGPLKGLMQPGFMAATLDRDAAGGLVRRAGVMAVVLIAGRVRPGDPLDIEHPRVPTMRSALFELGTISEGCPRSCVPKLESVTSWKSLFQSLRPELEGPSA